MTTVVESAASEKTAAAAAAADDRVEWETTIEFPSTDAEFEEKLSDARSGDGDGGYREDVIFLFDDATRLAARRVQRKTVIERKFVLNFTVDSERRWHLFPLQRTTAVEEDVPYDRDRQIAQATHRVFRVAPSGVRASWNKIETTDGVRYTVEYEIEYAENSSYETVLARESSLMNAAYADRRAAAMNRDNEDADDDDENSKLVQPMLLKQMFACVTTKMQMWHLLDCGRPFVWAYKWNGYKSKMLIDRSRRAACLWSDLQDVRTVSVECENERYLDRLANLCTLVEILEDRAVIVEIIGALFHDGRIYTTEPATNLRFLENLRGMRATLDGKPLLVQEFYDRLLFDGSYDPSLHDGLVAVQDNLLIKWKIPTVDAVCVRDNLYRAGDREFELSRAGEERAVYEIGPDYEILRRRNDRIAASNAAEYEAFLRSVRLLRDLRRRRPNGGDEGERRQPRR